MGIQLQPQRTNWNAFAEATKLVDDLGFGSLWAFEHLLLFADAIDD